MNETCGLGYEFWWKEFRRTIKMPGDLCTAPRIISLSPLSLAIDVTDATLAPSGLWLGTRTGAGGTATLTESFFGRNPWFHGQQVRRTRIARKS